jgi:thioredoxin reductase (NADPH)
VLTRTQISGLEGNDGMLEAVRWRDASGSETRRPIHHLFSFIGVDPNTDWLSGAAALDEKGFVVTGQGNAGPLETNVHGLFAVGDIRSGSIKRVAASVGEGAQVVAALHAYLAAADREPGIAAKA